MLLSTMLRMALQTSPGIKPKCQTPAGAPSIDPLQRHKHLPHNYRPLYQMRSPDDLQEDLKWLHQHFPLEYRRIPPERPANPRSRKGA